MSNSSINYFRPVSVNGHPRFFQINWLSQFNGLVYCESVNGGTVCYLVNVDLQ